MIFSRVYISWPLKIAIATLLFLLTRWQTFLFAQSGNCHPTTPFCNVDLSADPNGTWDTTLSRIEHCCGDTTGQDRCIEFLVTLAPSAVAINFDISPGNGGIYMINCVLPGASPHTPLCVNGSGPHTITYCKPGGNPNNYTITSIAGPTGSPDKTIGNGCNTAMSISGVVTSSITWNSIFPGATGAYNSYLSCTSACASTIVTSQAGHPPYVDYQVCGMPAAGLCAPPGLFCDTIRIYMSDPVVNTVNPNPASFCSNNPSVLLTGTVNGGVPPYTYAWTNGANGTGIVVGTGLTYTATTTGSYSFIVYDQNYPACPAPITNVTVTSNPAPIVNAGTNQTTCGTSLTLNGSVTGATGGIWSGGNGTFTPGNTALNAVYTPTLDELANGTVILTLTSTGNGSCSPVSDQVVLSISTPINVAISSPPVICYGQTATITANVSGGVAPYTYLWNTGETTPTISNVLPGTHSVTVTGGGPGFCTTTASVTLTTNPQIIVTTSPNNAISCSDTATISASASGGSGTLGYLWSNGATTSSTSVNTGTYTITVTDTMGCSVSSSLSVTASSSLTATINQPPVLCNGTFTTLTVTASGGLGGNTILWSNGATTINTNVFAGIYYVTVTDSGGCIASTGVTVTENPPLIVSIPTPSIVCNGSSATVNAFVSGGQPPYTFLWNTGPTTQSLLAPAGTYTVTVIDNRGCNTTASVTISQASVMNITMNAVAVECFGESNGSATATVTGGVPSYFFSWAPYGGSLSTATGLLAGTYTVTVTDTMGCSKTNTIIVTQPPTLTAPITIQNQVSCNGGSNGAATVNPTGGAPAYSYAWNPIGGTGQNATNLNAGSYTVTITDINGCTKTAQTNITEPAAPLTASIVSTTDVSCNGGSTGSATILAAGGTPGYSYSWAPTGGTNATAANLAIGTYTVTITDLKSCTTQLTIIINQPPALTSIISDSTNLNCNGGSNGTATVTPFGGSSPYSYAWNTNPIQTTATATNLSAGTYSVTVTDSQNCTTTSPAVTITGPPALTVTASPSSLISCDSSITINSSAGGGSGGYTYLWNNGATSSSIIVNTGSYIITVTDTAGCSANDSVSVLASNSSLTATINQPANICYGATATITVNVSGGLGSNTYLWNTAATTSSITAGAGSYCVTVTDAGNCITTACVTINQNPQINVSIGAPQNICPGGTATITAIGSGGQPAYSYLWNSGETTQSIIKPMGTYTVTLSDITGSSCSDSASITITEVTPISVTMSYTNVSCIGANNGTALVYASGGASTSYSYSWAPSGGSNASATQLGPGTYTVTVTDTIGCIKTGNVTITQPSSAVAINLTSTDNLCFGDSIGTATAAGSGGTAPYYYYWSVNADTTTTIAGLPAGTYSVFVADNTGCTTSSSVIVSEPAELIFTATATQISCFGGTGSVTLTASGGTGTLTFTGDDTTNLVAGTYNYTVTDANGCSKTAQAIINSAPTIVTLTATATQISCFGGTGSVTLAAAGGTGILAITGGNTTNLVAGTYNYTVTDANGCSANASTVINAVTALTFTATATQINCFGGTGSISLAASGGTGALTISGDDTTNLVAATYNYTVTDANGCTTNAATNINYGPLSAVMLTATATQISCFGGTGSVTLAASGGTGTLTITGNDTTNLAAGVYNYTATDANGCTANASATINTVPAFTLTSTATQITCFGGTGSVTLVTTGGEGTLVITGDDTTNLAAGTYNYTVTDTNGCTANASATINAVTAVTLTATATQISCFGGTGSVALVASGGTGTLAITGDDTTNLAAGTYNYIVTDANGCTANASATINPPPSSALYFVANPTQISCFAGTGSVGLIASGGTGALTITGDDTTNLIAGTYNYTLTDANGCTAVTQAIINPAPPALQLALSSTQINCSGGMGSVSLVASGGTGTLLITGDDTTNLIAGTYNYTVTDSNGCTATAQAIINTAPFALSISLTAANITCFGASNGSATATGNGGTSPFQYAWQNGDTTVTTTNLAVGSYSVTVTDDMGCFVSDSITISEPSDISLSGTTVASTCGNNNGSATVTAVGGTGTYTYTWSPSGGTIAIANNLLAGDYIVTVTDSNACQQQLSLTVASASFLIANFNATDECFTNPTQFNDSSITSMGSSITSWEWDFGNFTPLNYSQNPTYLYTAPGTYNVSLTVTSSNGCIATIIQPVIVHALPTADFVSTKVCLNSSTLFTDFSIATSPDSISSWLWNFGDSSSDTIQNPIHTYSLPGTFNTILLVTTNYGCIDTINMPATVYPSPLVQFIVADSSGCPVHCTQFTDMSNPLSGTITDWQWNFGDGSPFGTNPNEEHCYSISGNYTVSLTVTTSYGCFSTNMQANLLNVYLPPQAEFDYSPQTPTSLASDIYFNNLSVGASTWFWNFGDVNDSVGSSLQFPIHNYSDEGNYCITLVAQNNYQCVDTVVHCLQIDAEFTFFIPNAFTPSESYGTNDGFSGYGTNINKYDMWIFDRWGNMIFHTDDLKRGWDGKAKRGKEIAQEDVYVYLVKLLDFKGTEHQYRGTVTLVR